MRVTLACLIMAVGFASTVQAQQYQPSFRPSEMRDRPAGRPNEVLVLGTPHLSGLPDSFRPAMVEPLLMRLVRWRPTAIATENSSGLLCDAMRRQGERQASSVKSYCFDPTVAGQAAGLDVPAANAEADRVLAHWPATPSPAQRRRLVLVFLAAGEPTSALVQWFRLPAAELRAGDGLTNALSPIFKPERSARAKTVSSLRSSPRDRGWSAFGALTTSRSWVRRWTKKPTALPWSAHGIIPPPRRVPLRIPPCTRGSDNPTACLMCTGRSTRLPSPPRNTSLTGVRR